MLFFKQNFKGKLLVLPKNLKAWIIKKKELWPERLFKEHIFRFRWARDRDRLFKDTSEANIYWNIPLTTTEGTYKIVHRGHYTRLMTGAYPFEGESKHFKVKQKKGASTSNSTEEVATSINCKVFKAAISRKIVLKTVKKVLLNIRLFFYCFFCNFLYVMFFVS